MALTPEQIRHAFNSFIEVKNPQHRYTSYDYCYNYFNSFKYKSELSSESNLEKSCLHLGFYLASWGMLRASSFLLQKSLCFYKPMIEWLSHNCPPEAWSIDVNNYSDENIDKLINVYHCISNFIPNENRKLVLVTKIMLGVFGNTPAFDEYFTKTFREHYSEFSKFSSFNEKSLKTISNFYQDNPVLIDELRAGSKTFDFTSEMGTNILYSKAKIIDMIGFGHGYNK
jgi:hypothetical protein